MALVKKMKILAIETGSEDISAYPLKYGGCGRTLYLLGRCISDFYIAGSLESLRNCDLRNKIVLSDKEINDINSTGNLNNWDNEFDLIFHAKGNQYLTTKKPTLVWIPGQYASVHPGNVNILLHNAKTQNPQITNPQTKIYEFTLGISIPEFQEYCKEDIIFECSNHYPQIQSHILAHFCRKYKIKGVFAGPLDPLYKDVFLSEIDSIDTFYLGEISEEIKIEWLKKARFVGGLYNYSLNSMPLAMKQAMSYGCGALVTKLGPIGELIKRGETGFFLRNEEDFVMALKNKDLINQKKCWETINNNFSVEKMVESFNQAAYNILN